MWDGFFLLWLFFLSDFAYHQNFVFREFKANKVKMPFGKLQIR